MRLILPRKEQRALVFLQLVLFLVSSSAMACQPVRPEFSANEPDRVKANFDGAQFVVTAHVMDVSKVTITSALGFKQRVERATFRVERSFKGKLQPGDIFKIDSGISSCGTGVADGQITAFRQGKPIRRSSDYPKDWLIYYTAPPVISGPGPQLPAFEVTSSPLSRPVNLAAYDIDLLKKFSGQWTVSRQVRAQP